MIMKKSIITVVVIVVLAAWVYLSDANASSTWRYKITVEIETPEGVKVGSAIRQIGNSPRGHFPPEAGNPAKVKGEAVVVDLGKRGVLFSLISHESDNRFYNAFPVPGGSGGATKEGIEYYSSLPAGKKGTVNSKLFPSYPKLVTFTDRGDPKSVTLIQEWARDKDGYYFLKNDRFEEVFGKGVKLKGITLETTRKPVTWDVVDRYLPNMKNMLEKEWQTLSFKERGRIAELITFKQE